MMRLYSLSGRRGNAIKSRVEKRTLSLIYYYLTHNGEDYFYSDTAMSDNYAQLQLSIDIPIFVLPLQV